MQINKSKNESMVKFNISRRVLAEGLLLAGSFAAARAVVFGGAAPFALVYISAFFTINSRGTRTIAAVVGDFLAGMAIPIPFFPDNIRRVVELSPFGSMQNTPLLIFSGNMTGIAIVRGIGLQIFWIIVLIFIGRLWIRRALKRVIAQGG